MPKPTPPRPSQPVSRHTAVNPSSVHGGPSPRVSPGNAVRKTTTSTSNSTPARGGAHVTDPSLSKEIDEFFTPNRRTGGSGEITRAEDPELNDFIEEMTRNLNGTPPKKSNTFSSPLAAQEADMDDFRKMEMMAAMESSGTGQLSYNSSPRRAASGSDSLNVTDSNCASCSLLREEIRLLKEQRSNALDAQTAETDRLRKQIDKMNADYQRIAQLFHDTSEQHEETKHRLDAQVDDLTRQLQMQQEENQKLLDDRVARHAHRNAELAQRIDEITVDLANAKGEAKALTADNDRLSKLNKELSTTLRAISAENTETRERMKQTSDDCVQIQASNTSLESQLAAAQKTIKSLRDELARLMLQKEHDEELENKYDTVCAELKVKVLCMMYDDDDQDELCEELERKNGQALSKRKELEGELSVTKAVAAVHVESLKKGLVTAHKGRHTADAKAYELTKLLERERQARSRLEAWSKDLQDRLKTLDQKSADNSVLNAANSDVTAKQEPVASNSEISAQSTNEQVTNEQVTNAQVTNAQVTSAQVISEQQTTEAAVIDTPKPVDAASETKQPEVIESGNEPEEDLNETKEMDEKDLDETKEMDEKDLDVEGDHSANDQGTSKTKLEPEPEPEPVTDTDQAVLEGRLAPAQALKLEAREKDVKRFSLSVCAEPKIPPPEVEHDVEPVDEEKIDWYEFLGGKSSMNNPIICRKSRVPKISVYLQPMTDLEERIVNKEPPSYVVWGIKRDQSVPLPEFSGVFVDNQAYILLHLVHAAKAADDGAPVKAEFSVRYWVGFKCPLDRAAVAGLIALRVSEEARTTLRGNVTGPVRENQGDESPILRSLWGDLGCETRTHVGGDDDRLLRSVAGRIRKQMLQIKGQVHACVTPVPISMKMLNSGDVFVMELGSHIYQWNGKESRRVEQSKAFEVVTLLKQEYGGKCTLHIVKEDEDSEDLRNMYELVKAEDCKRIENLKLDRERLVHALTIVDEDSQRSEIAEQYQNMNTVIESLEDEIKSCAIWSSADGGDDGMYEQYKSEQTALYRVLGEEATLSVDLVEDRPLTYVSIIIIFMVSKAMLDSRYCYILDISSAIYVWQGKQATSFGRRASRRVAEEFLELYSRPSWSKTVAMLEGVEEVVFKMQFRQWS